MEIKTFEVNGRVFIAHIEPWENMKGFKGEVYFGVHWDNLNGDKGVEYISETDSMKMYREMNNECRKVFSFLFCWRGVWEGRIYFPNDSEYWSEELKDISDLWNQLQDHLKQKIRDLSPDYNYFDE